MSQPPLFPFPHPEDTTTPKTKEIDNELPVCPICPKCNKLLTNIYGQSKLYWNLQYHQYGCKSVNEEPYLCSECGADVTELIKEVI